MYCDEMPTGVSTAKYAPSRLSLLTHDDAFLPVCLVIEFLASTWSIGSGLKVVGTPSHC